MSSEDQHQQETALDTSRTSADEIQHGEAMGFVVRYHTNHVLCQMSIGELTDWAGRHEGNIHFLLEEGVESKAKSFTSWIIDILKLEDMRRKRMFERWPEAFPKEIKLNRVGEPAWPHKRR